MSIKRAAMRATKMNKTISKTLLLAPMVAIALTVTAYAAAPGIQGPSFSLTAKQNFLNQPDGSSVHAWGYGCSSGYSATMLPKGLAGPNATCPDSQIPGPTLIVTEGQVVTVALTNNLPPAAGNTSILFPGFQVCLGTINSTSGVCGTPTAGNGVAGLLAQEAVPLGSVTYSFVASSPGTRAYYSGTQSDLQVEMGLYGAVIVLPKTVPGVCDLGLAAANVQVELAHSETDWRLAHAAYD